MIRSMQALGHWLKSHDIDPDKVQVSIFADHDTVSMIEQALAKEVQGLTSNLTPTSTALTTNATIAGIKVRVATKAKII